MTRVSAKEAISGKIPSDNYIIVTDKGWADDLATAINLLTRQGWSVEHIWASGSFHFALLKRN